jgi:hypothetical protein
MKKQKVFIFIFIFIILVTGCGKDVPPNVKKGFEYYVLMDEVTTKILKGAKVKEVSIPNEKEDELIKFISSFDGNLDAPLEEHTMAKNLESMRLGLMGVYLINETHEISKDNKEIMSDMKALDELQNVVDTADTLSEYFTKYNLKNTTN